MTYSHTQSGNLVVVGYVVLGVVIAITLLSDTSDLGAVGLGVLLIAVGLVMRNFSRLSVSVDDDTVRLRFGRGWPRKRIAVADIASAEVVRNKWWFGLGIRLTPYGWLYNVWGLDAVHLEFTSGGSFRIGTDEPEQLVAAIHSAIRARQRSGFD